MPLVIVTRNQELVSDREVCELGPRLQEIVAFRLSCDDEGGKLTEKDIEVRFQEHGPFDVNTSHLQIVIFANDYASRKANLKERTKGIAADLKQGSCLSPVVFGGAEAGNFVWVRLAPAGFAYL